MVPVRVQQHFIVALATQSPSPSPPLLEKNSPTFVHTVYYIDPVFRVLGGQPASHLSKYPAESASQLAKKYPAESASQPPIKVSGGISQPASKISGGISQPVTKSTRRLAESAT